LPKCAQVPNLAERLTIYQIEHEIQQILWHGSQAEAERVPRIIRWLDGGVDDLLRQINTYEPTAERPSQSSFG
jgi:hypothetical protein